jgi:hypothetical protein
MAATPLRWPSLVARLGTASALLCTAAALALDLLQWAHPGTETPASESWRFVRTVACLGAAAPLLRHARVADSRSVLVALVVATVADFFLVLRHQLIVGIGIFAVMQLVLVHRHLRGVQLRRYLQPPLWRAAAVGLVVWLVGNAALWPALAPKGLGPAVLGYSGLLLTSAVTAWGTAQLGVLPQPAGRKAFYAMVLFVLCDITVGIGAAFGHLPAGQLVRATTGLFYTPCLLLLVQSGLTTQTNGAIAARTPASVPTS